ncbi:DNA adenine methylase [Caballeronia sp. LjRoot34]|uniref:DNA adenine methylase n=1 Tax=Caballeronia sp. LjRoot34 TaxID=3342325 RepID=UPI003ED06E99
MLRDKACRRLIEPFVGGGSVFLGTSFKEYVLGDTNAHLIELYRELSQRRDEFIGVAQTSFDKKYRSSEAYTEVRAAFNQGCDPWTKAAKFLYPNKFGSTGYVGTTKLAPSMFHRWPRWSDRGHRNARETNGRGVLLRHQRCSLRLAVSRG